MALPLNSENLAPRSLINSILGIDAYAYMHSRQGQDDNLGHNQAHLTHVHSHCPHYGHHSHHVHFIRQSEKQRNYATYVHSHFHPHSAENHQTLNQEEEDEHHQTSTSSDQESPPSSLESCIICRERRDSEQLLDDLCECPHCVTPLKLTSPEDIYKEIVKECKCMEENCVHHSCEELHTPTTRGSTGGGGEESRKLSNHRITKFYSHLRDKCSEDRGAQLTCVSKEILELQHKIQSLLEQGVLSLDELVKMIMRVVENVDKSAASVEENPTGQLTSEQKRRQNNEAASRYRRRQKEAKDMAENELRFLERRNSALKRELLDVQSEIASLKLKEAETSLKIL